MLKKHGRSCSTSVAQEARWFIMAVHPCVVSPKFLALVLHYLVCRELPEKQVPFDYAQGRLSAPLKNASLRMTGLF